MHLNYFNRTIIAKMSFNIKNDNNNNTDRSIKNSLPGLILSVLNSKLTDGEMHMQLFL